MSCRIIRIAHVSDAQAIQAIYAPLVEHSAISFELEPPSVAEMARRIETTIQTYPYFVAQQDGQVIGYAYAGQYKAREAYKWSVEVSVYVAAQARRSGVGRALYQELLAKLKQQGFHAAYAGIALPNERSVGLHESLGFVHLGIFPEVGFKHGKWHDLGYWRIALADATPPAPIIAFAAY
ncbi:arsinothricin resistance N-acetyltransferase ArsN1 family B [Pseudomonas segetis]|uniref:Phosphinothricin acetyltransferase n=1 Tax=Pseudomonas segetis TaxID=298908 RepID=A0A239JC39_9PSED|nr:arsinothricin resistance N-acetyltransferase ArsN1 family B [Pseudomonas segetis]SNT03405.1 phosphinothricin acetyltransferase [Pseudomonas segetis]